MNNSNLDIELLKCTNINKWYGNLHALKNVDLNNNELNTLALLLGIVIIIIIIATLVIYLCLHLSKIKRRYNYQTLECN